MCAFTEFIRKDDDFLLRFLHARKMNVQESFQLLVNYYSYRQRNRHLFVHLNAQDESIQLALKDGFPGVLQQRDRYVDCLLQGGNFSNKNTKLSKLQNLLCHY